MGGGEKSTPPLYSPTKPTNFIHIKGVKNNS